MEGELLAAGTVGPLADAFPDVNPAWLTVTPYAPRLAAATASLRPRPEIAKAAA